MRSIGYRRHYEEWSTKRYQSRSTALLSIGWSSSIEKVGLKTTKNVSFSDGTQDFMLVTNESMLQYLFTNKSSSLSLLDRFLVNSRAPVGLVPFRKERDARNDAVAIQTTTTRRKKTSIVAKRGGHRKPKHSQETACRHDDCFLLPSIAEYPSIPNPSKKGLAPFENVSVDVPN